MTQPRRRIAVDMDEVLTDSIARHLEWYARDYGRQLGKADIMGSKLRQALPPEHLDVVMRYPHREGFFKDLAPLPGALEGMAWLCEHFEVFIATAAMEFPLSFGDKYDWLQRHLPFVPWSHYVFCGNKGILHADFLIDDNAYNLDAFRGQGLLFSAPHNVGQEGHVRLADWAAVRAYFEQVLENEAP